MPPCPSCRCYWTQDGNPCERCRRLRAVGTIVDSMMAWFWVAQFEGATQGEELPGGDCRAVGPDLWDALDAVAHLLVERGQLVRRHRKELAEEVRDGQAAARESFTDGLDQGRRGD